jgi:hypothetical protein
VRVEVSRLEVEVRDPVSSVGASCDGPHRCVGASCIGRAGASCAADSSPTKAGAQRCNQDQRGFRCAKDLRCKIAGEVSGKECGARRQGERRELAR